MQQVAALIDLSFAGTSPNQHTLLCLFPYLFRFFLYTVVTEQVRFIVPFSLLVQLDSYSGKSVVVRKRRCCAFTQDLEVGCTVVLEN